MTGWPDGDALASAGWPDDELAGWADGSLPDGRTRMAGWPDGHSMAHSQVGLMATDEVR